MKNTSLIIISLFIISFIYSQEEVEIVFEHTAGPQE